jgi:hypothetical protein
MMGNGMKNGSGKMEASKDEEGHSVLSLNEENRAGLN